MKNERSGNLREVEEMIKFVMEKANHCYADDFPICSIQDWIREFFDRRIMKKDLKNERS